MSLGAAFFRPLVRLFRLPGCICRCSELSAERITSQKYIKTKANIYLVSGLRVWDIALALRVVRVGYSSRGLWEHGGMSYGAVYVDKNA